MSLRFFNPSSFDADIYAVEVKGLGRGKGVKVTDKYSILEPGNEVVEKIGSRLLELLEILFDKGCLEPYDVYKVLPENFRDEIIEDYVDELDELRGRLAEYQELVEELSEEMVE